MFGAVKLLQGEVGAGSKARQCEGNWPLTYQFQALAF